MSLPQGQKAAVYWMFLERLWLKILAGNLRVEQKSALDYDH